MYDLLLTRYHDMTFIMSLNVETVIELIQKAFQKHEEERAFALYASIYPNFNKNNFKPFNEFYKAKNNDKISVRSAEDIMADAQEIMRKVGEKRGTV